jgi:translation elongation factor EF-G
MIGNSPYKEDIARLFREGLELERLHGKTILVAGATGLVGGCVVDVLMQNPARCYKVVAHQAFKVLCPKAGPVLMEPIMKVEVVTPEENMGDVIGDLNKRRGLVQGMEEGRSGARIVKAMVPLAEMFGYVTALRTITSGRATSSMEYDHHAPLSSTIAKAVLEEVKGHAELL